MAPSIEKQEGVTESERFVANLCNRSFLSLWSYPSVFRDQFGAKGGDGKELCDVLVIFGHDILIFSDKDCRFPDGDNLDLSWARWFKRAVRQSADQAWGAERWLRQHPERVYVDRKCTTRLPLPTVFDTPARFHRIVVAHDAARKCRELLGGSGTLMIFPDLEGQEHETGPDWARHDATQQAWARSLGENFTTLKTLPFTIGDLAPERGFVHVFDDTGFEIIMRELNTAPDLIAYLTQREQFIRSKRLIAALGEEELLAHYLQNRDKHGNHTFDVRAPKDVRLVIPEGAWETFAASDVRRMQLDFRQKSLVWDRIIERFNKYILNGESAAYPDAPFEQQELAVRALARENRKRRLELSIALADFLSIAETRGHTARVVFPSKPRQAYHIFLTVTPLHGEQFTEYRHRRRTIAHAYLVQAKRQFKDAKEVVVIATETPRTTEWASEDVLYRDHTRLTASEKELAAIGVEELKVLTKVKKPNRRASAAIKKRFMPPPPPPSLSRRKPARNDPCPCKSGKKFKKCCGAVDR